MTAYNSRRGLPEGTEVMTNQFVASIEVSRVEVASAPALFNLTSDVYLERQRTMEALVAPMLLLHGFELGWSRLVEFAGKLIVEPQRRLFYHYWSTPLANGRWTHSLQLSFGPSAKGDTEWQGHVFSGPTDEEDTWPLVPLMLGALMRQFPVADRSAA